MDNETSNSRHTPHCKTCGDDGVLCAVEYVNGRDVEVREPCNDCCGEDDYDDRELTPAETRESARLVRDSEASLERLRMLFGAAFVEDL